MKDTLAPLLATLLKYDTSCLFLPDFLKNFASVAQRAKSLRPSSTLTLNAQTNVVVPGETTAVGGVIDLRLEMHGVAARPWILLIQLGDVDPAHWAAAEAEASQLADEADCDLLWIGDSDVGTVAMRTGLQIPDGQYANWSNIAQALREFRDRQLSELEPALAGMLEEVLGELHHAGQRFAGFKNSAQALAGFPEALVPHLMDEMRSLANEIRSETSPSTSLLTYWGRGLKESVLADALGWNPERQNYSFGYWWKARQRQEWYGCIVIWTWDLESQRYMGRAEICKYRDEETLETFEDLSIPEFVSRYKDRSHLASLLQRVESSL